MNPFSDPSQAQAFVLTTMVILGVYTVARAEKSKKKDTDLGRQLLAIGALAVGLGFLADVAPSFAAPFALAILVAAVVANPTTLSKIIGLDKAAARG